MISKIRIKNFRQIEDQTIDFSSVVVIVGPNNGGKTTVLQAISLFGIAISSWAIERPNSRAVKRTGIAIGIEELLNIPVTEVNQMWRGMAVREGIKNAEGKPTAKNIRIEIHAEGITKNTPWKVGFEFDYGRDTLIYARLTTNPDTGSLYEFPEILAQERIGYLPSISGLSSIEDKLGKGSIFRLIGQGKTADVLRNVCLFLYEDDDKSKWKKFIAQIEQIFKITLNAPQHNTVNGTLSMSYYEREKKAMDISSLGSGAKQTILLFAYIMAFPNSIHLLDEPDAHLEVIRQSNIYDKISDITKSNNTQIIIASHSESVLERAFSRDTVVSAVFGQFEIVNNKKYLKSTLTTIGYEQLLIAKQQPRILYVEGTTDFDFLKAFAKKLDKIEIADFLDSQVLLQPIGFDSNAVKQHFATLKEFIPSLVGLALFDNLRKELSSGIEDLVFYQWKRNEIENYLPLPMTAQQYVSTIGFDGPLFTPKYRAAFDQIVEENTIPAALRDSQHGFWTQTKMSDNYLTPIFEQFFTSIEFPKSTMDKSKFYKLVDYAEPTMIDEEVGSLLDDVYKHLADKTK